MDKLDQMKIRSQIAKHKANVAELDYKIFEREQDIERIREGQEKQKELVKELEAKLME